MTPITGYPVRLPDIKRLIQERARVAAIFAALQRYVGGFGIRALVVHALHDKARKFYLHHGFSESAIDPLVLMLRIRLASTSH